jgi:hypothetical protein
METGGLPISAADIERAANRASDAIVRAGPSGIADAEARSETAAILRQLAEIAKEENGKAPR